VGPTGHIAGGANVLQPYPGPEGDLLEGTRPHVDGRLDVLEFDSYAPVLPWWRDLERRYKRGELVLDFESHRLMWEHYHGLRGYELRIFVFVDALGCAGIVPLTRTDADPCGTRCWSFSDDMLISREYFVLPERFAEVLRRLPPHFADDLSCFYRPADTAGMESCPGGVTDIKASCDEYLTSLGRSARHNMRNTLRRNGDLRVEVDTSVRWDALCGLEAEHLERLVQRGGAGDPFYREYCRQKLGCDFLLMDRAAELGRLLALHIYLEGELVAVNLAVRREEDRVDDYMCLRRGSPELARRGLGIAAILLNMEECRKLGIRYYDLSASNSDYKQRFMNGAFSYLRPEYAEPDVSASPFELSKLGEQLQFAAASGGQHDLHRA
jgi:hypothetical protein